MSELIFDHRLETLLGSSPEVRGSVYPPDHLSALALAQVILTTGAAALTFYPSPAALDALAADLTALATALRDATTPTEAGS